MLSANAFDAQLEIDLDMIRADEHADSGCAQCARSYIHAAPPTRSSPRPRPSPPMQLPRGGEPCPQHLPSPAESEQPGRGRNAGAVTAAAGCDAPFHVEIRGLCVASMLARERSP